MSKIMKFEEWKPFAEIVISFVSAILVLFTLFEMQADRNAAYMPDLYFSDVLVAITWGNTSSKEHVDDSLQTFFDAFSEDYTINAPAELRLYNIGVGTAKNITLEWDHEANIAAYIEVFKKYKDIHISFKDNILHVETPSQSWTQGGFAEARIADFMMNSTDEYHSIQFPYAYSFFVRELFSRSQSGTKFPTFSLVITYTDVQNKTYSKEIAVSVERLYYTSGTNKNGAGLYNLHFTEEKDMRSVGSFILNGDSIATISSICAIVTSIASICFTTYFSVKQNEHNRNSVRPIASIILNDYEDLLAVKIENVGTGPLLITSLKLTQGDTVSKSLISLMPVIGQTWSTFVEEVDGRTIPAGGSLTLIKLEPRNDSIKKLVRETLSKITVSIEYSDIYSTKFTETRSLDFFGRHFT